MRLFWAAIALLAVIGAVVLFGRAAPARPAAPVAATDTPAARATRLEREAADAKADLDAATARADRLDAQTEALRRENAALAARLDDTVAKANTLADEARAPAPSTTPPPAMEAIDLTIPPGEPRHDAPDPTTAAPAPRVAATPEEPGPTDESAAARARPVLSAPAAPPPVTDGPQLAGYSIAPGTTVTRDDGTLLVDDRYVVTGDGTPEKPYVVTWEMLTSVQSDFDPHTGKKRFPHRVAMLDGKHVRLTGYVSFPMMQQNPRELLSMLNQWDGCCIGVPPTPYDAVEVMLAKTITGNARFTTSGTVTGRFLVKPFLSGDWLVGLYVMEGATLDPAAMLGGT